MSSSRRVKANPEKQGLKQRMNHNSDFFGPTRVKANPEKQGLKPALVKLGYGSEKANV